ncbi:MAG TPA: archaellin/type IV pilin N-terminal domain-containing protein [Candidatus Bathyarchaeia archaeon]|nr:archaellin/type IV pilin N-terminal domain-containing protein [Candidatus Bathyarchaeia archaeon]
MTLFRMLKSKKGISPILATLLLIVIAVAAIIVTYAWVMTYVGTQTTKAGVMINYENVRWYGTPTDAAQNRTDIVIVNSGTSTVAIVRVYLGTSADDTVPVPSSSLLGINATIQQGKTATITILWPIAGVGTTWNHSQTYYFVVATDPGTQPLTFSYAVQ